MSLSSATRTALLVAIALLAPIACRDNDTPTPTSTPAATSTPTRIVTTTPTITASTPAPLPTVVQRVIDAVAADDGPALTAMAEYQRVPCTTRTGAGGPPKCKPGDPDGTVYRVFATGSCEGTWTDDASQPLSGISALAGPVYAVAAITPPNPDPEPEWPKGKFVLLFRSTAPDKPAVYFIASDTAIVRAHISCGAPNGSERDLIRAVGGDRYLLGPS